MVERVIKRVFWTALSSIFFSFLYFLHYRWHASVPMLDLMVVLSFAVAAGFLFVKFTCGKILKNVEAKGVAIDEFPVWVFWLFLAGIIGFAVIFFTAQAQIFAFQNYLVYLVGAFILAFFTVRSFGELGFYWRWERRNKRKIFQDQKTIYPFPYITSTPTNPA
jgi:hypothetical protein